MSRHNRTYLMATLKQHIIFYAMLVTAMAGTLLTSYAGGENTTDPNSFKNDLLDLSLEELMDIPIIVSASRSQQKINKSSVPVSVITAEDIHYSGLSPLTEILQFSTGMDSLPIRRNFYANGVRGLHDILSERTLVLIDGRSGNSPFYGGSEYFRHSLLAEDIERIEIVRGPGGAAWGANAYTGVINIITKKPKDVQGGLISTTFSHFGDSFSHVRYGFGNDFFQSKISAGYNSLVSSDQAGAGDIAYRNSALVPFMDQDTFYARDYYRQLIINNETTFSLSEENQIDTGIGYTHFNTGGLEFMALNPKEDMWINNLSSFARINHQFEDDSTGYLQFSINYGDTYNPSCIRWTTGEYDLEGQYQFSPIENHVIQIGSNVRLTTVQFEANDPDMLKYPYHYHHEYQAGLFAIDTWQINSRLTLENQLRGDVFSEVDNDYATRITALYDLNDQGTQTLRFSIARSYRTPMAFLRDTEQHTLQVAPNLYALNLVRQNDLKNEQLWSFEAGYRQQIYRHTTFNLNGYYQKLNNVITVKDLPDPTGLGLRTFHMYNDEDIYAFGAEAELEARFKPFLFKSWYAFNDLDMAYGGQDIRAYSPSKHKAGLTWRIYFNDRWTFNSNYRFIDSTYGNRTPDKISDSFHRLDLTLNRTVGQNLGELMIGVSDLLNRQHDPNFGLGQFSAIETPGRTFFARFQLKF